MMLLAHAAPHMAPLTCLPPPPQVCNSMAAHAKHPLLFPLTTERPEVAAAGGAWPMLPLPCMPMSCLLPAAMWVCVRDA